MKRKQDRYELTKPKYLNDEEQLTLHNTLTKFQDTDPRNTALIWLLLHSGGRAQEVLNITAADLDPKEMTVFIKGLKDSDNRDIPLPAWLFHKLKAISPEVGRIFPITYVRLWQIWREYRPAPKKLHSLRHSFAINVYRRSKDILILKMALGHRSLGNTMIYSQFLYKGSELRKGILG